MDIVFCVDYTSSITSYFDRIRTWIIINCLMVAHIQGDVRIGLIKFRSFHDLWTTRVYGFTRDINVLQQWLYGDEPGGICPDGCEAVGDALNEALNINWRAIGVNQVPNEKLVILITDGAPNGLFTPLNGVDPWVISNRFREQDITLVVAGVGESIVQCDDFYCALAKNTGGQYIPMVNFERLFREVVPSVLIDGDTFHQAFGRLDIEEIEEKSLFKYSAMKDRVTGMINECETMNDIRNQFFNHLSHK